MAVSVTTVPAATPALQVAPQLMPPTLAVTVPDPLLLTDSVYWIWVNVAATVLDAASVTVQVAVPLQPPPFQPVKAWPDAGVAVSVTAVPAANAALHAVPQSMPAGADRTLPEPLTTRFSATVSTGTGPNSAPTERAAAIVTTQLPVPEHAPVQPLNCWPEAGTAASVTLLPCANNAVQALPQLMPAGLEPTEPLPPTVTVNRWVTGTKVAETPRAAVIATVHVVALPLQPPPLHAENRKPLAAAAVRVTEAPSSNAALHAPAGQAMPAGAELTTPEPAIVTSSWRRAAASWLNVASTFIESASVSAQLAPSPQLTPLPLQPLKL